ncbi:MAG TPA: 6-carboxytetrahydropterin synthase [Phycisphaerales bacterium]|nr:6-carboxytetrahydropterin synthase [Phycisphaerales bacterium]
MFTITVQSTFSAAHALVIAGQRETLHGHDFLATVEIKGDRLDQDGLVCDFHTAKASLDAILAEFNNANLNEIAPFNQPAGGLNPTAENIAQYIFNEMHSRFGVALEPHAKIAAVSITESPGCATTYRP